MIRIDENTYIDDSLVTCAEYQLFIDEMREKGEYYQPDHWISYQFPAGQAHTPIVGVRYSDAVKFCGWLTDRERNEWFYFIPSSAEAKLYQLKKPDLSPLGYWTLGSTGVAEITWVNLIPATLNFRELSSSFDNDPDFLLELEHDRNLDHGNDLGIGYDLDRWWFISTLIDRVEGRSPAFEGIRLVKERKS
jgi:hypothetical protein